MQLSSGFSTITPLSIRKEKAYEIFTLLHRLSEYNEHEYIRNGGQKGDKVVMRNGERIIFRKAGKDSLF